VKGFQTVNELSNGLVCIDNTIFCSQPQLGHELKWKERYKDSLGSLKDFLLSEDMQDHIRIVEKVLHNMFNHILSQLHLCPSIRIISVHYISKCSLSHAL
jgi:hypothetical protein